MIDAVSYAEEGLNHTVEHTFNTHILQDRRSSEAVWRVVYMSIEAVLHASNRQKVFILVTAVGTVSSRASSHLNRSPTSPLLYCSFSTHLIPSRKFADSFLLGCIGGGLKNAFEVFTYCAAAMSAAGV